MRLALISPESGVVLDLVIICDELGCRGVEIPGLFVVVVSLNRSKLPSTMVGVVPS